MEIDLSSNEAKTISTIFIWVLGFVAQMASNFKTGFGYVTICTIAIWFFGRK